MLRGWQIGVLETLQSGPPFTVVAAANTTNAFPVGTPRPNLVGDPALPDDERTFTHWFNIAMFVNPPPLTFGNSPRCLLRGPGIAITDLMVEKGVGLGAGMRIDIRAEANNLLNRASFNIPGFTLGAPDFGVISSARAPRTVQLGGRVSF